MAWSMKGYRGDPGRQGEQVRLVTIHYLLFYCLGCYVACRVTVGDPGGQNGNMLDNLLYTILYLPGKTIYFAIFSIFLLRPLDGVDPGGQRGRSKTIYFTLLVYSFLGCKMACRVTGQILGDARGHLPLSRVTRQDAPIV